MANEQRKQTGTNDPANRPNQPGQNPSGQPGQSGQKNPKQQNPGDRRSDEWSDTGSRPGQNDPSRQRDDDDMEDMENPA